MKWIAFLLLFFVASTGASQASPVTILASGYMQQPYPGYFEIGDEFAFEYTYNPDAIDYSVDWRMGLYTDAVQSISLEVGTLDLLAAGGADLRISKTDSSGSYFVSAHTNGSIFSPNMLGTKMVVSLNLEFVDPTNTVISNDEIFVPSVNDFADRRIQVYTADSFSHAAFGPLWAYGKVTNLQVIPEPNTAVLVGLGLLGFGARRRGN